MLSAGKKKDEHIIYCLSFMQIMHYECRSYYFTSFFFKEPLENEASPTFHPYNQGQTWVEYWGEDWIPAASRSSGV